MSHWGKAQLLKRLKGKINTATVLESHDLDQATFQNGFGDWWLQSPEWLKQHPLAVRSDHDDEGAQAAQNAGRFLSVLSVPPCPDSVREAAANVFASYDRPRLEQRLFVQPMASDVRWSGVITSRSRSSGAPYFVVHESPGSDTGQVTRGSAGESQVTYIARQATGRRPLTTRHASLVRMIEEMEDFLGHDRLELEFVTRRKGLPTLLQARKLDCPSFEADEPFVTGLHALAREARAWWTNREDDAPGPVFSVMADWNPAEIIGRNPKPLATSLYRKLITDFEWAQSRADLGYHMPARHDLLRTLGNTPYIDVDLSFQSLTPAGIRAETRHKLTRSWIEQLKQQPSLHDAVELQIAETCFTVGTPARKSTFRQAGLNAEETEAFCRELKLLTQRIMNPEGTFWHDLEALSRRLGAVTEAPIKSGDAVIPALVKECKQVARLFGRLARSAFIGVAQLDALVACGAVRENNRPMFFRAGHTTTGPQSHRETATPGEEQLHRTNGHSLDHLRPGTYDIERHCYRDRKERVFSAPAPTPKAEDALACVNTPAIQQALDDAGMGIAAADMVAFIVKSIAAREDGKFLYSYYLSQLIEAIAGAGEHAGVSREQLSMLELSQLMPLTDAPVGTLHALGQVADQRRKAFDQSGAYVLPDLLVSPDEVFAHTQVQPEGHYFGQGVISGETLVINDARPGRLRGRIVVLEAADPGYEFLFGSEIAALVTCYGGVNSHMAVRCQESGTPGVLGIGSDRFRRLLTAQQVTIDFDSRRLEICSRQAGSSAVRSQNLST
ncbi:PEP-utilizing enzyme [Marinihelvus fidelis]|uniref:PEP-utilizing enzyme n=1 Tax=Marinihelvus fidelis TaxID=2613842 RepID=UPI0017820E79|nr:PEP-utilizing enzyme [Marinihelvus fidelis]